MDFNWIIDHSYLIPLLPLVGAILAGFFGAKILKGQSHWPIWLGVGAAAVLSISLFSGMYKTFHKSIAHQAEASTTQVSHDAHAADHAATPAGSHLEAEKPGDFKENASADSHAIGIPREFFTWIHAGDFKVSAGFWFDPLTTVMLCVVTGIGFFITVFAAGYMKGEAGYFRFFAYLGLFIFMMTILVMGDNLIMLYLGWEGVGLCSYLLIGYYYDKPSAREAAKKAFLVNRVGDFGFGLGIMLAFLAFGTVSYFGEGFGTMTGLLEMATKPQSEMTPFQQMAMQWLPFLLMLGAFGKSAQFPLYVWLPDAMEGPTPVSALIHAATMVTAGVYMIGRCSTLFVTNSAAMMTVAVVGAFTALFAALIALRQMDLKKVFAYSTISQLGYMFVGMGVAAPVTGVFHLITHAFFKALLFLSSGVVMHAMMGELDMRKMSGLKKVLPWTNRFILVGCLALAGFPLLSGFFSKDEIVAAAFDRSMILGLVLLLAAFLTAYYTFRLYFRVFQGPLVQPEAPADGHGGHGHDSHDAHGGHDDHAHHNHEPFLMMFPLLVLTLGAIVAGYINWPERDNSLAGFLAQSPSFIAGKEIGVRANTIPNPAYWGFHDTVAAHGEDHGGHPLFTPVMLISGGIAIAGIWLAYLLHLKNRSAAERLAMQYPSLVRILDAKFWVDEVYQRAIVEPLRDLGRAFFMIDRIVVDGVVWLISFIPQLSGFALKITVQRGSLQGYATAMLLGVVIILIVIFL